jgi:hypothetical protein
VPGAASAEGYAARLQAERQEYGPFTLLLWELGLKREAKAIAVTNAGDNILPYGRSLLVPSLL